MTVVSNTSPISNLAIIGKLSVLRSQFGSVLIPSAVERELAALAHVAASEDIRAARSEGWLQVVDETRSPLIGVFEERLDPGEAAAIAVAVERKADLLLIDESEGREMALAAGIRVRGVLGILHRAKQAGEVASLRQELQRLRTEAYFFVSPDLAQRFLEASDEA